MEIITKPRVKIIGVSRFENQYGGEPLDLIKEAGTTCYQSNTKKTSAQFAAMLAERGHYAMLEFVDVTVRISDCSRGLTHELVRHRLCSFAQRSTRYVNPLKKDGYRFVMPPDKDINEELKDKNCEEHYLGISPSQMLYTMQYYYKVLIENGWAPEDARQFLPIGIETEIVIKANLTEWVHIFKLRTAKPAHWEIRSAMVMLLKEMQEMFSPLYDKFKIVGQCDKGIDYCVFD